jgi:hypothetical protein
MSTHVAGDNWRVIADFEKAKARVDTSIKTRGSIQSRNLGGVSRLKQFHSHEAVSKVVQSRGHAEETGILRGAPRLFRGWLNDFFDFWNSFMCSGIVGVATHPIW